MTKTKLRRLSEAPVLKKTITSDLPFIKKDHDQILFWSVKPSGDYDKDCQTGREYAALALK